MCTTQTLGVKAPHHWQLQQSPLVNGDLENEKHLKVCLPAFSRASTGILEWAEWVFFCFVFFAVSRLWCICTGPHSWIIWQVFSHEVESSLFKCGTISTISLLSSYCLAHNVQHVARQPGVWSLNQFEKMRDATKIRMFFYFFICFLAFWGAHTPL